MVILIYVAHSNSVGLLLKKNNWITLVKMKN